jgi:hypothetical protein
MKGMNASKSAYHVVVTVTSMSDLIPVDNGLVGNREGRRQRGGLHHAIGGGCTAPTHRLVICRIEFLAEQRHGIGHATESQIGLGVGSMATVDDEWMKSIKRNAALVVRQSESLVDFPFGYDERSVAWLEDFIVRMRKRGDFFKYNCEKLSAVYGCFLGEAMIARHGGQWHSDDLELCVLYEDNIRFFPIAKVRKLIENGLEGGDSILGIYAGVPMFIEMLRADRGSPGA